MPVFDKQWREMGLDDNDLQNLQVELLKNPQIGNVIRGTGKLRKMRFAFHVDFVVAETIYLIFAYPKNEKDNLTDAERNNIKKLIDRLEQSL